MTHSIEGLPAPSRPLHVLPDLICAGMPAQRAGPPGPEPGPSAQTPQMDREQLCKLGLPLIPVKARKVLFREGERLDCVYAVYSGTFKSCLGTADGREQVADFRMSGDLLGLDGLAHGWHTSSAVALEDAQVCPIPHVALSKLDAAGQSDVAQALVRLLSLEIVREQGLLLLGSMQAEEKLAVFLLNLSARMKAHGYSGGEFNLRMSRADIGSYLGLTVETVSRTFSGFQHQGLLAVDKRHVHILDLPRLSMLAKRLKAPVALSAGRGGSRRPGGSPRR